MRGRMRTPPSPSGAWAAHLAAALRFAGLLAGSGGAQTPGASPGRPPYDGPQMGVTVTPETVAVGRPFVVSVRVRAARGATIIFPAGPDSGGPVEALDPLSVKTASDSTATDEVARYRLAAWDVGRQSFTFPPVVVRASGETSSLAVGEVSIAIASIAPSRAAARVPKAARAFFPADRPWWWLWAVMAALAAIGLVLWLAMRWWLRRRRRAPPPESPLAIAEHEFESVERLGLLDAGERGRYVALLLEVVRRYLARQFPEATLALTSTELLDAIQANRQVPLPTLRPLLEDGDAIKFARAGVTTDSARRLGREARLLIEAVDRAIHAASGGTAQQNDSAVAEPATA